MIWLQNILLLLNDSFNKFCSYNKYCAHDKKVVDGCIVEIFPLGLAMLIGMVITSGSVTWLYQDPRGMTR